MSRTSSGRTRGAAAFSTLIGAVLAAMLLPQAADRAVAQEAAGDELPLARIGLIDANVLYAESQLGKRYVAKVEALQEEIQTAQQGKEEEASRRRAELNTLREELQQQADTLSPEERSDKALDLRRKERELQAFVEDGESEIQRLQQRAQQEAQRIQNEYQQEMRPHIDAVAREMGVDFLLDRAVALILNPAFDISKAVIAHADAAEQEGGSQP
jgi:Skp family chaperone for outer membrane proteins